MLRVKNIHYIMASVHVAGGSGGTNLRIGESKIPRGLTVQLKITLHDNMGNEILHNWDATEHLGHAVARRDGLSVHIDSDFKLTVSGCRVCRLVGMEYQWFAVKVEFVLVHGDCRGETDSKLVWGPNVAPGDALVVVAVSV